MLKLLSIATYLTIVSSAIISIEDFGCKGGDSADPVANTHAISKAFSSAVSGDTVLFPAKTFHVTGGIVTNNIHDVTISIQGNLIANDNRDLWFKNDRGEFFDFWSISESSNVTINGGGIIDGKGAKWWNDWVVLPILGHQLPGRPKLFGISNCEDFLIEHLTLLNSPSWHLNLNPVTRFEIRYVTINVDRFVSPAAPSESFFGGLLTTNPLDLNTDGIDIVGSKVWVHDCKINNDDDSIAVKPSNRNSKYAPCTQDILVENSVMSGYGASIGSVPPSSDHNCVTNVVFRNISMPHTGKGIYIKSNPGCDRPNATGEISNILYENINIYKASMWAIWIGPQQMHSPGDKNPATCGLTYPISQHCPTQGCVDFRNITLRNVVIDSPILSPGVILGNVTNPMQDIIFDNVQVKNPSLIPFGWNYYKCEAVNGKAINSNDLGHCFNQS